MFPKIASRCITGAKTLVTISFILAAFWPGPSQADTFGSGGNTFVLEFATIGNPGNPDDSGAGGGSTSLPYGGVPYVYRMAKYEVSQTQIDIATAAGMQNVAAGGWTGNLPAANIRWFEAAAFVNWLNTSTGYQEAYRLTWNGTDWTMALWSTANSWQAGGENRFRHLNAHYFLPSDDEWYKAAFHMNDGPTGNYWDYPTASNQQPDGLDFAGDPAFDAVMADPFNQNAPNPVTSVGAASAYGIFGLGGNVWEVVESAADGINSAAGEARAMWGGSYNNVSTALQSSNRSGIIVPNGSELLNVGFRVASVPEPSATLLVVFGGCAAVARRRRSSRNP